MPGVSPSAELLSRTEKVNILLVDDRPDGLLTMEAVLKCPEYNLVKAKSGREALSLVLNYDFAVILLDVQMPEMDGFQTAKHIKKSELCKHIPIIFVTAISKDQRHIDQGYQSGAVDYLFKPFEPHILKSKVGIFVDLYRKNLQIREQAQLLLQSERRERERRFAELQLENQKRYENLADAIPHIVMRLDPDGNVDYLNQFWIAYTGLEIGESLGEGWASAFHRGDYHVLLQKFRERKEGSVEVECRIKRRSGSKYRWHLVRMVPELSQGAVKNWLATCTDIHDRKEAEEQLELKVQERTLQLSRVNKELEQEMDERMRAQREVLEISEREQKRIGRDLHDGLAQELVAISFMTQILEQKLREQQFDGIGDAQRIQVHLKKAVEETRSLSRGFYPIELERHGLLAAVQEMVVNTEKMFSIAVPYRHDPGIFVYDKAAAYHLYRIVQEAIHNVVKHAKASVIEVSITQENDLLSLIVKDNGTGFKFSNEVSDGMGLRTMHYRARTIGASLTVESEPGKGTRIICKAPLQELQEGIIEAGKEEVL